MTEELIDKIEKYLNGELTESERISFEGEITNDAELKDKVEFMRAIPLVAKKHAQEELKKKLDSFSFEGWYVEGAAAASMTELTETGSARQSDKWRYLAVAASVVLVVGIFFLINRNNENKLQLAKESKRLQDSINAIQELNRFIETPIASTLLPVNEIGETSFGFADTNKKDSLVIVLFRASASGLVGVYGKFQNDTIYFSASESRHFEVFRISANNTLSKPNVEGIYLMEVSQLMYRIPQSDTLVPLTPVGHDLQEEILKYLLSEKSGGYKRGK